MKRALLLFSLVFSLLIPAFSPVFAVEDPLSVPNNKFGIHILFDSELSDAATLVNSHGGDWGYVIIPIQANDRNLTKWQHFMDEAKRLHLIPIIRLATEGDYFNTTVWRKPTAADVLDFANFLNSLDWPTKNHYVVLFNEVNRGDEWGGSADASEYAQLVSYAVTVFKSLNTNFFLISSGMDNAAPNQGTTYIDEYEYLREMNQAVPGIFNQLDGVASHSYPNPGFSQPPDVLTSKSIDSFAYERTLLSGMTSKKLPIFITETGWSADAVDGATQVNYYKQALETVWSDPDIVAILPFILRASGPFAKFSFFNQDGTPTLTYQYIQNLSKTKGTPKLTKQVLAAEIKSTPTLPVRHFTQQETKEPPITLAQAFKATFAWVMRL